MDLRLLEGNLKSISDYPLRVQVTPCIDLAKMKSLVLLRRQKHKKNWTLLWRKFFLDVSMMYKLTLILTLNESNESVGLQVRSLSWGIKFLLTSLLDS